MAATIGCSPLTVTFTNSSLYATSYLWNFGDGSGDTVIIDSIFTWTFNNSGNTALTYTIKLTAFQSSCTNAMTRTLNLDGAGADFAFFTVSDSVDCTPLTVNFQPTPGAALYEWDFDDTSNILTDTTGAPFTHTFYNSSDTIDSTYTVQVIATGQNGCIDTTYKAITVYPGAIAQFTVSDTAGCSPLCISITNTSINTMSCKWNWGDGDLNFNCNPLPHCYINTSNFADTFLITLSVQSVNGCTDTATKQVMAQPLIQATANVGPLVGCHPLTVAFLGQASGSDTAFWDFGDSNFSSDLDTSHTYYNFTQSDTVFTAKLIAYSPGCGDTAVFNITVHPKPVAVFTPSDTIGCAPLTVTFTDSSIGALTYIWKFGDGDFDFTPGSVTHTYGNSNIITDTFLLTLIVENADGCKDTLTQNIIVYPEITAIFVTNPPDTSGCSPFTVDFNNQTFPSTGNSYQWNFGDALCTPLPACDQSSLQDPTHTYVNNGLTTVISTVQLIATSSFNCTDTAYQDIIVLPKPVADFTTDASSGCAPLDITITNNSTGAGSCYWDFGDGTVDTTCAPGITHTYYNQFTNPIFPTLQLIVVNSDGCTDTLTQIITVYPQVTADFASLPDTVDCSPFTVDFNNQTFPSTGNTYQWDFGDALCTPQPSCNQSNLEDPTHTYINSGITILTNTVQLIATSPFGCIDTAYQDIVVLPKPAANFTATPDTLVPPNSTVTIVNNSTPGLTYIWDYGDGNGDTLSSIITPDHTYVLNTCGKFTITLVVQGGNCTDTMTQDIAIFPTPPSVAFGYSPDAGCIPLTVTFYNNTQGVVEDYLWYFGDGTRDNNPSDTLFHTYFQSGTFTVKLVAYGCAVNDSMTQPNIISTCAQPQAFFQVNQPRVFPDRPVCPSNLSGKADSYWWDFGDGYTTTEKSPCHSYKDERCYYSITLVASNSTGCVETCYDTLRIDSAVCVTEGDTLLIPSAFTPIDADNGGIINPFITPTGAGANDVFFPLIIGIVVQYNMQIFNKWGELIFESNDVTKGWSGFYKGKLAQQDMYVYKVFARFQTGSEVAKSGYVLLLR
ncbi:MAG: PKD domain-containing protein [Solirubrobacterales bacterium]|nr:PKD domain-containing protein [Solirubrobacterales bacterium]